MEGGGGKGKEERGSKFEHWGGVGAGEQFECLEGGEKFESLGGRGAGKFLLKTITDYLFMRYVFLIIMVCYSCSYFSVK